MPTSRRARADERAQRVNAAVALLAAGHDVAEAARRLAGRYGLSERQARRYVERARSGGQVQGPGVGPEPVFDRLGPALLAQAYQLLVPECRGLGAASRRPWRNHADRGDLRPGLLDPPDAGTDDPKPDGRAAGPRRAAGP